MKIIIEHSKTKREIFGAFSICGSYDDLKNVARTILGAIHENADDRASFSYGWIQIRPLSEANESIANTPPVGWDK